MDTKQFFQNAETLTNKCLSLLKKRNDKYNDDRGDRLGNFKRAAELLHTNPLQAAAGHASKHIICLQDMIASGEAYPREQWEEELMDNLNYILLMYNVLEEMDEELIAAAPEPPAPKKSGRSSSNG